MAFLWGGGAWLDLSKALFSGIQKNLKVGGGVHVSGLTPLVMRSFNGLIVDIFLYLIEFLTVHK